MAGTRAAGAVFAEQQGWADSYFGQLQLPAATSAGIKASVAQIRRSRAVHGLSGVLCAHFEEQQSQQLPSATAATLQQPSDMSEAVDCRSRPLAA